MAAGKSLNDFVDQMFVWTHGSFGAFVWMGGSGCTIALMIAIMIFSKRDDARALAKNWVYHMEAALASTNRLSSVCQSY